MQCNQKIRTYCVFVHRNCSHQEVKTTRETSYTSKVKTIMNDCFSNNGSPKT